MTKYDIFISYRRDGGYDTAKHLYDLLTKDGYRVSFDIDTLGNGDFDEALLKRIDDCRDFILILNKDAFERTLDPDFDPKHDWLRQELAYALKKGKNIIPIFLNGFNGFPDKLPPDISEVTKKNGPAYNQYYFNDFYRVLKKRFLHSRGLPQSTKVMLAAILIVFILSVASAIYIFMPCKFRTVPITDYDDDILVELPYEYSIDFADDMGEILDQDIFFCYRDSSNFQKLAILFETDYESFDYAQLGVATGEEAEELLQKISVMQQSEFDEFYERSIMLTSPGRKNISIWNYACGGATWRVHEFEYNGIRGYNAVLRTSPLLYYVYTLSFEDTNNPLKRMRQKRIFRQSLSSVGNQLIAYLVEN